MSIFKVPGSQKFKRFLLGVLTIVAVIVVTKVVIEYKKPEVAQNKIVEDTKIEEPKEEEKIQATVNEEEENLNKDARSTFDQGDYKQTIEKANAIIAKFPDSYKAYNIRGFAKAFNVSFEEGMKDIDKGLSIKPDYWYGFYAKAFNYELYDKFEEALVYYDKSLEVEKYMWTYYGKASIYGRQGDVANTVDNLKKAIEVEGAKENESGIKKEAKTEADFDPVRGNAEFEAIIK